MLYSKAANKLIGTFYTLRGIFFAMANQGNMVYQWQHYCEVNCRPEDIRY